VDDSHSDTIYHDRGVCVYECVLLIRWQYFREEISEVSGAGRFLRELVKVQIDVHRDG